MFDNFDMDIQELLALEPLITFHNPPPTLDFLIDLPMNMF